MADPFEEGKQSMEELLSQFDIAIDPHPWGGPYGLVVPENHLSLIPRGSNSLVFELPPVSDGDSITHLVGKTYMYTTSRYHHIEGELHLSGKTTAMLPGGLGLEMTLHWLEEMEIKEQGVELPRMEEYMVKIDTSTRTSLLSRTSPLYVYFVIMPDLRENGRYQIGDAEEFDLNTLKNGDELKETYEGVVKYILEECNRGDLVILPAGHGSEEYPEPAIRHMFLVQHGKEGNGKLVAGDLNHLAIYHKGHQFGTVPDFLKSKFA